MTCRKGSFLGTLILMGVSLLVALLLGEFMLRVFYPQDLRFNVTQYDAYIGFSNIPGISGSTHHRDFTMQVQINSKGLRDREYDYDKPEGVFRVGIFGDSFTFGEGVQNDETYPAVLETLINSGSLAGVYGDRVEVLNFGTGKTGTSQQYALYRKEGVKYELDAIVLGFLGGNDFIDNTRGVFRLVEGKLVHDPAAYSSVRKIQKIVYRIPFYRWLAANSHLVNFARIVATRADDRARDQRKRKQQGEENTAPVEKVDPWPLSRKLVEDFMDAADAAGVRFIFMNLPAKYQETPATWSGEGPMPDYITRTEKMLDYVRSRGGELLDLVPVFAGLPVSEFYFEHDGHMNPAGNRRVAEELGRYLADTAGN